MDGRETIELPPSILNFEAPVDPGFSLVSFLFRTLAVPAEAFPAEETLYSISAAPRPLPLHLPFIVIFKCPGSRSASEISFTRVIGEQISFDVIPKTP